LGLIAVVLAGLMLAGQLAVTAAVILGIQDNQGTTYAMSVPMIMYCVGLPLAWIAGFVSLWQRDGNRTLAERGLALSLAGPLVFVLTMIGVELAR
jgi:hypothetical protein